MPVIEQVRETAAFLEQRIAHRPEVGIILGSGLGDFSKEIEVEVAIPYAEIPHFPVSTVDGHSGTLIFGSMGGKRLVVMAGRFHYYEGYPIGDVVFPVRVMKFLGIHTICISNAAGGVNPAFRVGDIMIINDHISFATVNPLIGPNEPLFGPRFPDMSEPYHKGTIAKARAVAERLGIPIHEGVYFGVTGPTFETRAEYRMIRLVGADAVGMSTVPEVIVACHMGLKVFAMSVITDLGIREEENTITHEEVLEAAHSAAPRMAAILKELLPSL
jgi:purine-nucleoside phosphorylase